MASLSHSLSPFTGTFSEIDQRCNFFGGDDSLEQFIFRKIDQTAKDTLKKCEHLKYATDAQKGVQLIHMFVMDMLEVSKAFSFSLSLPSLSFL
jgi:hypothetical protein